MYRNSASKIGCLLAVVIIVVSPKLSFALNMKDTFFANLDSTILTQSSNSFKGKLLATERYLRLLARLSIFGLHCDEGNRMGYSTRVSVLQRGSVRLEKWANEIFGSKGAYNRFEKYRNQESLRYVQSDRASTCKLSEAHFHFFTGMDPKDLRIYLSNPPFGSL